MTKNHPAQREEVMAFLDGELARETAERVRLHLAACEECRRLQEQMRGVSTRLAAWDVEAAPPTLQPRRRSWRVPSHGLTALAASLILVAGAGAAWLVFSRPAAQDVGTIDSLGASGRSLSRSQSRAPGGVAGGLPARSPSASVSMPAETTQGTLVIRTAQLRIVPRDFDDARTELERIIAKSGGFLGRIVSHGDRGNPRVIEATLRIPAPRLDETLAALRALGHVSGETREGEDVTRLSADLDARLTNARRSETRLRELLEQRTGSLADVLAVEREVARVRYEIESMEAERKSLDQRVTYAAVTVTLTEERNAEVNLGSMSVSKRLRNAVVEGWTTALGLVIGALLIAVRATPALLVLAAVFAFPGIVWFRHRRP